MHSDGQPSSRLNATTLTYLRQHGEEVVFTEGAEIVRRGDAGQALWVVVSGEVEVQLRASDGRPRPLARLGPGEAFGEMAILLSAPASADVVAVTAVTALRYPAEYLPTALAECEPLRQSLLSRLAQSLHRTTAREWGLYRQTQTFAELYHSHLPSGALVTVSGRMRRVQAKLRDAAAGRQPVLIGGEPGSGKLFAARLVHDLSERAEAPLISVDCRQLTGPDAEQLLLGVRGGANEPSDGFGALHLAHGGTLVLRDIDMLPAALQAELATHLEAEQDVASAPFPDVRLIATRDTYSSAGPADAHSSRLVSCFATEIEMPALMARRRDILPLARAFLGEIEPSGRLELSASAEQALVALKYRNRNVDELRSVLELAVRVADGPELRAEHVFSGYDSERAIGLDIRGFWLVRWLTGSRGLRLVRLAVALGFFAAAALCLAAASTPAGRAANGMVWAVWEPLVFGLFLLVGSVWCTVCPLSSSGVVVQRLVSLERPPPAWLQRWGVWLSAAGFVLILWSEELFDMASAPFATGVLLLALVAGSVICCGIWQREVWCRWLCPLGRLGVALAPVAPLTVAARRSVCTSTCTTHDCYKGNDAEPGCPVFHHPQLVSEAHRCKTCLTCLRSCPHGSAGVYLRPRLRSAWRLGSVESYVMPFALTVFLLSPVLVLAQSGAALASPWWLTLACLATLCGAAVLGAALTGMLQTDTGTTALVAASSCALLVLGWGPLMAYEMGHIPVLGTTSVVLHGDSPLSAWLGGEVRLVVLMQVALVVFAATLSAIILWNALGRASKHGQRIRWPAWWGLIAGCTAYTALGIWLVVGL